MSDNTIQNFEAIVAEHQRSIINFHYRFVGDRMEAENLAQETFIKAYLKLHTLKEPGKLKNWLYSIARHVVIDSFRKNKNREIAFDDTILQSLVEVSNVDFHNEVAANEISRELQKCIDTLGEEDRLLIKLLYYEGFSYKEISELLKINQNTLKSRLHRARRLLFEAIEANDLLKDVSLQYR
jgi:RNA polymerase sigma-70 factor, ECF subfamily